MTNPHKKEPTCGKVTIPLDFQCWYKWENKTKLDLAREMIAFWKERIAVDWILMDGLYCSEDMMSFLDKLKIFFIMRLPKNRIVQKMKGQLKAKIGDHWQYRLQKNSRIGLFKGLINGKRRFIVAAKRRARNGEYRTIYMVTNLKQSAERILETYSLRWNIEKFFRTAKKKLGLQDCQTRKITKQNIHTLAVFAVFGMADSISASYGYDNVDEVIRMIRSKKIDYNIFNPSIWRIFYVIA